MTIKLKEDMPMRNDDEPGFRDRDHEPLDINLRLLDLDWVREQQRTHDEQENRDAYNKGLENGRNSRG